MIIASMTAKAPQYVVMILFDAFRPDYLTLYELPNLTRLAREGVWVAECRSVFPSTTTTNLTSFVTGAWPKNTTIPNNTRFDRENDRFLGPLRHNAVPTVTDRLHIAGFSCLAVNYPTFGDPAAVTFRTGDMQTVIAELKAAVAGGTEKPAGAPQANRVEKPLLLLYYSGQTDAVGHNHGPFSPEMAATVAHADREIGGLLAALAEFGMAETTLLLVASDHGISPNDDTPIQPALDEVLQEAGFTFAKQAEALTADTELVWLQSGSAFLYWRHGRRTPAREAALHQALHKLHNVTVMDAQDIRAAGADPLALGDMAVVPHEGYSIVKGSGSGGWHGRPQEAHNMLLFWGAGVQVGKIIHRASIIDAVPTVLGLLGVDTDAGIDGRALHVAGRENRGVVAPSPVVVAGTWEECRLAQHLDTAGAPLFCMEALLKQPYIVKSMEIEESKSMVSPLKRYVIEAGRTAADRRVIFDGNLPADTAKGIYQLKFEQPQTMQFIKVYAAAAPGKPVLIRLWVDNENVAP